MPFVKKSILKLWGGVIFSSVKTLYLLCKELDTLRKFWGGVSRFSLVETSYFLCKELDWCLCFEAVRDSVWLKPYICSVKNSILAVTLVAKRTDICINWKLTRDEFSKKRPKLGLWSKNDKSFEKQLSPPAFQVLACWETTQRELIIKKLLTIEISHANCL